MDLQAATMARAESDIKAVSERMQGLSEYMTAIQSMDLPDKFRVIDARLASHSERLDVHDGERHERVGAVGAMRFLWALIGALGAVVVAVAGMFFRGA